MCVSVALTCAGCVSVAVGSVSEAGDELHETEAEVALLALERIF